MAAAGLNAVVESVRRLQQERDKDRRSKVEAIEAEHAAAVCADAAALAAPVEADASPELPWVTLLRVARCLRRFL